MRQSLWGLFSSFGLVTLERVPPPTSPPLFGIRKADEPCTAILSVLWYGG